MGSNLRDSSYCNMQERVIVMLIETLSTSLQRKITTKEKGKNEQNG